MKVARILGTGSSIPPKIWKNEDLRAFNTIQRFGSTTTAPIPLGLDEAVKVEKFKPGMLVGTAAFGGGFTWASALILW